MRNILIVTPYLAPQTHAAVFRAHKLAKFLPRFGWKPYVLTVDTNYLYNEDPGLLDDLPPEVEITRARYIEPTARGVRMAAGGEERTFRTKKRALVESAQRNSVGDGEQRSAGLRNRGYSAVLQHLAHNPDAYWTWRRPAIKAATELMRRQKIDIVYSTALPLTSHQIAMAVQAAGPKWVADFRDPVTYAAKTSASSALVRLHQQAIVRETLQQADAVTGTSSTYGPIFRDMYGEIARRPVTFIPTGVDDDLIPKRGPVSTVTGRAPYLIYVGEVMPDQTRAFFELLSAALNVAGTQHRLLVVGHEVLNRQRLGPLAADLRIADRIDYLDHMPQRELYPLIIDADAGILAPGRDAYWWNNHAKLVDYVGLKVPVLALVPDPSEARSVLMRSNLGIFLDGSLKEATATLVDFLTGKICKPAPNPGECNRYLASTQVVAFSELFESLV